MSKNNGKAAALPGILAARNSLVPQDSEGASKYPTVNALLQPIWKDGKCTREAGSIRIRIVGSFYLVCVTCPTEQLETTATLTSVNGLMEALEAHCVSPTAIWTPTFDRIKKARQDVKARLKEEEDERRRKRQDD